LPSRPAVSFEIAARRGPRAAAKKSARKRTRKRTAARKGARKRPQKDDRSARCTVQSARESGDETHPVRAGRHLDGGARRRTAGY
jgi:hypothetical protein